MFFRIVSVMNPVSPPVPVSDLRVMMTSTVSLGRMKPPAEVSAEICVATARLPDGRIDDMKLRPSPTSLERRSGSPAYMGTRATAPTRVSIASASLSRVMYCSLSASDGHACHRSSLPTGAPIGTSPSRIRTSFNSMAGPLGSASTMICCGGRDAILRAM